MKINGIELIVDYDLGNSDTMILRQSIFDSSFTFGIFNKEKDKFTDTTKIDFNFINELRQCLNDFEKRFNKIKTKKIMKKYGL